MTGEHKTLLAVVYEAGRGTDADLLLADLARSIRESGMRLAGTVQRSLERADRCACDMIVRDLASSKELRISEDRGSDASGCRLDPRMLEELVGSTVAALEGGADVVIINKFGKQEAAGEGFREAIATALADAIPTIVAVNSAYLDAWRSFAAEFADELPPDASKIRDWLAHRLPDRAQLGMPEGQGVASSGLSDTGSH